MNAPTINFYDLTQTGANLTLLVFREQFPV